MSGAAMAPNRSCTEAFPEPSPNQPPPPEKRYAMAYTTANGRSRTRMSVRIHAQLSGIRVSSRRVEAVCVAIPDPIKFEVFFDYQCPFVFRLAGLLDSVRA